MRKIFLYGPSGSGKSTVGKVLAESLALEFLDLDVAIESALGVSISSFMTRRGEAAFREAEAESLTHAVSSSAGVIALGGGSLLRDSSCRLVEAAGDVILLDADLNTLAGRLHQEADQRPLLSGNLDENLRSYLEKRQVHYDSFKMRVSTIQQTPDQIAWEIQRSLGRYCVQGMGTGYNVMVQPNGLAEAGRLLRDKGLRGPVVLVSDTNIAPLYADRVVAALAAEGYRAQLVVIPAGEEFKTLETVTTLWRGFLQAGLDRKSTVVALGGGVVCDLAGFAASTFMRGCDWVAVPTTLLAMVDASMGGKTGFDLPEGKNLVGSFYPPKLVLSDPQTLASLPEAELRSGLAEVVKHGIISDPKLFELCARGFGAVQTDLTALVRRASGVKIQVIEQDPFEKGVRASLNLGHTLGHAVELVSGFRLRHGEAVAIGMVVEARLAERMSIAVPGLAERIASVLTGLGLPVEIPTDLPVEAIIARMQVDKKKSGSVVRFALPVDIGRVEPSVPVADLELLFEEKV